MSRNVGIFDSNLCDLNTSISPIGKLLGEEDDSLYSEIFEFLKSNGLNTCAIPTIDDLGTYKGGYSLVKKISRSNGLKAVRKKYVPWAMKKVAEENPMVKESKPSNPVHSENSQDLMAREYLDEILNLRAQLDINQKHLEQAVLNARETEEAYNKRFHEITRGLEDAQKQHAKEIQTLLLKNESEKITLSSKDNEIAQLKLEIQKLGEKS